MSLFEGKSAQYVLDSLRDAHKQEEAAMLAERKRMRDFYAGGDELSAYLTKHVSEDVDAFNRRKQRFTSINYVTPLADKIIDGLYGPRVDRGVDGGTETDAAIVQSWYDLNNMDRKMLENGGNAVVVGDGWVKPYWDETSAVLRLAVLDPNNIKVISRGDDYERVQALFETRLEEQYNGGKIEVVKRHFVWTAKKFGELREVANTGYFVEADGKQGQSMQPNIYGVIPYAHWRGRSMPGQFCGLSMLRDAVTIQKEINNRASVLTVLILMQGFSQLLVKGEMVTELKASETGFLRVSKDSDASYLQPNAPITECQDAIEWLISKLFETGNVPISAVRSGSAMSGVALAIEYKPLSDVVQRMKTQARESESDLFLASRAVQNAHGPKVSEAAKFTCDFPETFLPTDRALEMMNDLTLLNNQPPLMSREEFWKKWNPDLTQEQLDEKAAKIDAAFAEGRQARAALFPRPTFGAGKPEDEEELEE